MWRRLVGKEGPTPRITAAQVGAAQRLPMAGQVQQEKACKVPPGCDTWATPIFLGMGSRRNPGGQSVAEMGQGRHPALVAPGVRGREGRTPGGMRG